MGSPCTIHSMLTTYDTLFLFLWLSFPIVAIAKWSTPKMVLFSAIGFYLLGIGQGLILSYFDPGRSAFIDHIWILVGIPASLMYCFGYFLLIKLFARVFKT